MSILDDLKNKTFKNILTIEDVKKAREEGFIVLTKISYDNYSDVSIKAKIVKYSDDGVTIIEESKYFDFYDFETTKEGIKFYD